MGRYDVIAVSSQKTVKHEQVADEHYAEHRAHKRHEHRREAAKAEIGREAPGAVGKDQHADSRHERDPEEREAVHADIKGEPCGWRPGQLLGDCAAGEHGGCLQGRPRQGDRRRCLLRASTQRPTRRATGTATTVISRCTAMSTSGKKSPDMVERL
jgi:hypothetical protein